MRQYLLIASVMIVLNPAASASAQQANRPATPAPAATPSASLAVSKIAVINTDVFYDPKNGISRLVNAVKGVDQEFQPRRTELQGIRSRHQALIDEINKTASVADPKAIQQKRDQAESLQRELDFKAKEAEAAYNKRLQEALEPIFQDLNRVMDAFAKQRGIMMILDAGRLEDAIIYVIESSNITREFIAEYNRRNP